MDDLAGYEPLLLNGRRLRIYASSEGEAFIRATSACASIRGRTGLLVQLVPLKANCWLVYVPVRWEVVCG